MDHTGKIWDKTEEMIAKPLQEAAGEATQKAEQTMMLMEEAGAEANHKVFCDSELPTNAPTRKEKTEQVDMLTADIDELQASIAQLAEDTKLHHDEKTKTFDIKREALDDEIQAMKEQDEDEHTIWCLAELDKVKEGAKDTEVDIGDVRTTKPQEKESLAQVICFDQGMPASVQKLDDKRHGHERRQQLHEHGKEGHAGGPR